MSNLDLSNVKRIFTFGCSFTDFYWSTWANILAYDNSSAEFYNFGHLGCANNYTASMVTQADAYYKFCSTDLVIVQWTEFNRESRWIDSEGGWCHGGSVYNNRYYTKEFVKNYCHPQHFLLRDSALIHLTQHFVAATTAQHAFLTMSPLPPNSLYDATFTRIKKPIATALWGEGGCGYKAWLNQQEIHPALTDSHPSPIDHLQYLRSVLGIPVKQLTIGAVEDNDKLVKLQLQENCANKDPAPWCLDRTTHVIRQSDSISHTIIR